MTTKYLPLGAAEWRGNANICSLSHRDKGILIDSFFFLSAQIQPGVIRTTLKDFAEKLGTSRSSFDRLITLGLITGCDSGEFIGVEYSVTIGRSEKKRVAVAPTTGPIWCAPIICLAVAKSRSKSRSDHFCDRKSEEPQHFCDRKSEEPQHFCDRKSEEPQHFCDRKSEEPQHFCDRKSEEPQHFCDRKSESVSKEARARRYLLNTQEKTLPPIVVTTLSDRKTTTEELLSRGSIAKALAALGVRVSPDHNALVGWCNDGITLDRIRAAVAIARRYKPLPQNIPAAYLDKIIREEGHRETTATNRRIESGLAVLLRGCAGAFDQGADTAIDGQFTAETQ